MALLREWTSELREWLPGRAAEVGFDLAGVAPAAGLEDAGEALDAERFASWVDAGRAGEMEYLKRRDEQGQLLRSSVRVAMPWARSVVVCALSYNVEGPYSIDAANGSSGWIARYAWTGNEDPDTKGTPGHLKGTDYHDVLLERLQTLAADLERESTCQTRCYVDTGPLLERSLAARAGVGWIGKNTCVLNQQRGSWLLLGAIVTSLPLPEAIFQMPAADRCGSCTRCIDACPTEALTAPHQMDASRCIAYLTIEKKGSIPLELREAMGRQVFGCDICQEVCPWNRKAAVAGASRMPPRPALINPDLEWIAEMTAADFKRWFKGSPLERTRRSRLHRNVAIAMGNSGETRHRERLREWSNGEDPVLAEAAVWALSRLDQNDAEGGPAPGTSFPR